MRVTPSYHEVKMELERGKAEARVTSVEEEVFLDSLRVSD